LPEFDPATLEEIKKQLGEIIANVSAQSAENAAAVRDLLHTVAAGQPNIDLAANEKMAVDIPNASTFSISNLERHNLSDLVAARYKNQSRESAESIRTKEHKEEQKENATQHMKPPSERQLLATRIYDVLRLDTELGSSTGLNRRTRHTTLGEAAPVLTGNVANAQAAALTGATAVSQRASVSSNNRRLTKL
jgi:hypothetical protein